MKLYLIYSLAKMALPICRLTLWGSKDYSYLQAVWYTAGDHRRPSPLSLHYPTVGYMGTTSSKSLGTQRSLRQIQIVNLAQYIWSYTL